SIISSQIEDVTNADKIILPGVGHFRTAMANIQKLGLLDCLNEAVLVKRKAVLGICLGLQLMSMASEESHAPGLQWLDAESVQLKISGPGRHKVPHMGWNRIGITKASLLMRGVEESSEFYFAHSYYLKLNDRSDLLNETEYSVSFPSAVERNNIFGVQYHPEKSHRTGVRVLKNFIEM
ncbi:MAG TPA: imidazole glycerol phosphate synthase subunit HisH, partial [Pyrinomonadaceae bacterium]|nr:imidazole glycerol phosphate synthase subunit HisH [Pyrinomonadaceae bacterium]